MCFGKAFIRNAVSLGRKRQISCETCVVETLRLAMKVLNLRVFETVIETHRSRSDNQDGFEPVRVECDIRICDRLFL